MYTSQKIVFLSISSCVHHTTKCFLMLSYSSQRSNRISLVFYSIKHPFIILFQPLFSFYSLPFPVTTEATVINRILISIRKLHPSMYFRSSFTTSSKSVISDRPDTCHIPVIPGFKLSLRLWCGEYWAYSPAVGGRVPTRDMLPPDVKIETTFFSEKIFQHHTMQLPSKTAQKKNL